MKRLPDRAIKECVNELRGACRMPIDHAALEELVEWLRPNFETILGHPEGARRWAEHGQRMRDNARHLGAFADFFANHAEVDRIGIDELTRAFKMIRADCTVRAERTPLAYEYCRGTGVDTADAEVFLQSVAPLSEPV